MAFVFITSFVTDMVALQLLHLRISACLGVPFWMTTKTVAGRTWCKKMIFCPVTMIDLPCGRQVQAR